MSVLHVLCLLAQVVQLVKEKHTLGARGVVTSCLCLVFDSSTPVLAHCVLSSVPNRTKPSHMGASRGNWLWCNACFPRLQIITRPLSLPLVLLHCFALHLLEGHTICSLWICVRVSRHQIWVARRTKQRIQKKIAANSIES